MKEIVKKLHQRKHSNHQYFIHKEPILIKPKNINYQNIQSEIEKKLIKESFCVNYLNQKEILVSPKVYYNKKRKQQIINISLK